MPPPVTPSPHRFLISTSNPPLNPRFNLRPPLHQQPPTPQISSHQFASTPKFSHIGAQKILVDDDAHPQSSSPLVATRRFKPPPPKPLLTDTREAIEGSSSDLDDDEEGEEKEGGEKKEEQIGRRTEVPGPSPTNTNLPLPSSPPNPRKRPRLDPLPSPHAYADTITSSPPSSPPRTNQRLQTVTLTPPRAHIPSTLSISKFLPPPKPTPRPPPPTHDNILTPAPPKFLLPSPASPPPQQVRTPLTPPRHGAKYVPGGLASSLRDVVLETSARYSRRGGGDEWDVRLRAGEVRRGSGMVLLLLLLLLEEEEQEAGQEQDSGGAFQRKWVLMGSGEVRGGDVVGVRRPIWEVDGWRVGVEWKVLDGG